MSGAASEPGLTINSGLSDQDCCAVLPLTDDVMRQLHEKHPEPQEARLGRAPKWT